MIPIDKVKNIIKRYDLLEKELSSGKFDAKLFAKKSKEYSDLKNIIEPAKEYVDFEKNILEKYKEPCPEALVQSAIYNIKLLEDNDFFNFKISV